MKYIVLAFLIVLVGCQSYKPPKEYDVVKTKEFRKGYDEVWGSVIAYFAENNIPIENLEKASGFIKAKPTTNYSINELYFDCGETTSRAKVNEMDITYNITVAKGNTTKVTINVFTELRGLNIKYYDVYCNSTGVFENEIFEYIGTN